MSERAESPDSGFHAAGDDRTARRCYRTLVDVVDGGLVQLDGDDRVIAVDDTILEMTGYTRNDVLETHLSRLFSTAAVERVEATLRVQRRTDASDVTTLEVDLRTADGAAIPCTLRLDTFRTSDGTDGAVGIVSAVDRPESAVRGVRASGSAEPFGSTGTVLEAAEVGVFVLDESFDVVWINEATERYFGIDRADVVGQPKRRLVAETLADRVADEAAFTETLLETYADNSDVERFECRVRPGPDREERWLEHRSKPIESGPYAGGRIELYHDVTDQHRRAYQLRRLNEAVREWLEGSTREDVAQRACHHITDILGLEINGVYFYEPDTGELQPAAWSESSTDLFDELPTFAEDEGIAWRVFDTGEPEIYSDVTADPDVYNPETPIRSEICLPIGDHGVVIIGSETQNAFDDGDLSLAKIVASSLETTFDRIQHEHQLERERAQTEKLLQTAPVAISVTGADGETLLLNRHAREVQGLTDAATLATFAAADEWTVTDSSGAPLTPEQTPAARVRATGEPVVDEELVVESQTGDRTWFSVNAAPVFADDGSLERVITIGEDITTRKAHERSLERRKSELESELSEILGRISDGFYALDEAFRFTHVNETAEKLLGRSREDLLGEVLWDVFPEAVGSDLDEQYHRALKTQESVSFERDSGPLGIWAQVQVYPSETGLSIYFRDITARKAREQELATYETIVETVEDGIYVLDEDERFTTVNDAYAELTGYDREELLGAHASLVVDDTVMSLAREVAVDARDVPTIETTMKTKDGSRVPIEASVTTLTAATSAGTSATASVDDYRLGLGAARVGVVRDVTERNRRQRLLEESEQRYRTLAENFPGGVVALFDEELRYTAAGGQLLGELGLDRETTVGQTVSERYPDEIVAELEPHFQSALAGEECTFELTYRGRELLGYTLPIQTGGDVTTGMFVVQDVTERKEYQRKLEESNERLEQFAYAASHDLQEPLRMVSSYLQLIDRRYGDCLDENGEEFLAYAVDGAERMKAMIEGLLEYSRVETQGDELEPVDLADVVDDVREDLMLRIAERDASVTVESLPRVRGDADQLRQVFQNLLENAITYSGDEPPQVHVSAERAGAEWIVSVRDEGIGMDPDNSEQIFEVFQRLHTHDKHPGTGIGLALCYRIVERHGGEIWVETEPGEGSTFSFTVPAIEE